MATRQTTGSTSSAEAPQPAAPAPSTPRRLIKITAITLSALGAVAVLFSIAANAAVSTFAAHDHGTLDITINGEPIDLDQQRFHDLDPQFHVHEGHGNLWHHHPTSLARIVSFDPMSLRQALEAMGIELTDGSLTFDGEAYDLTGEAVSVTVRVNGEPVDLDGHTIADGDHITVQVATGR